MSQHKSVTICHGPLEKELCCPSTAFPQVPGFLCTGDQPGCPVTTEPRHSGERR